MAIIDINWTPSKNELRVFAALEIVFFGIVAWLINARTGAQQVAVVVFAVAVLVGLIGLVAPAVLRPIYVVWMAAVFPIGWIVSHVMMAVVFYLVVTPIGLIMRLCGRDPLRRRFDRGATSYWTTRQPSKEVRRYFRQF